MVNIAHLIPIFPFLAFVINIFWGQRLKEKSALVSVGASLLSLLVSLFVFQKFLNGAQTSYTLGRWLTIHNTPLYFGVIVDGLSVMMLLVVTIVATLIKIYSIGYMQGEARTSRYFAYISLFTASMLGLVLADNFLFTYIFWEGVGLCSYLLISFWFERPAAAAAGLKAFITTRIGDTCLLVGLFLLFIATQSFHFSDLSLVTANEPVLTIAALLIFAGAVGKSAQFPLHVWLPDAMEGPTAVSALIHAATMVAAGVYLVARSFALFVACPLSLEIVGIVGAISALMAASMALVNNDIKRILAYSTISQLGLMMVGLSVGGPSVGTFHLMTHAFFKALLFLGAGSVIHAVHTQDIWKMGALFGRMKTTAVTFIIGALALSGIAPLSGFWSKDEILVEALHHPFLLVATVLTSLMTAFYMARLIFVALLGRARSDLHPHECPQTMKIPLIILSVFAALVGFLGSPFCHHVFQSFIAGEATHIAIEPNYQVMIISTVVSLTGIALAYLIYIRGLKILPAAVRVRFQPLYQLLLNKYNIDEIYEAVFIQPVLNLCRFFSRFDMNVVDGLVNGAASVTQSISSLLRRLQTGVVQNYLLVQVLGVIILMFILLKNICFPS